MNNSHFVESTARVFPAGVGKMQKLQQLSKEEKPINIVTDDPSLVIDTRFVRTIHQFSSPIKKEEPLQICKQEIPVTLGIGAPSLFVAVTNTRADNNATLEALPTVVKKEFESQQTCKEEIPVPLRIEAPSLFLAMTNNRVDYTTQEVPPTVFKKEFECQQTCKEEIPVTLGIETPSFFVAVSDAQLDNYTNQQVPPTEVKKEFESQEIYEEETPVILNSEASSLVGTLIGSQHVVAVSNAQLDNYANYQVPSTEVKQEFESQQTYDEETPVISNSEAPSLAGTVIGSQHVKTTSLVSPNLVKEKFQDACKELVNVTTLLENRVEKQDVEITLINSITEGTSGTELAKDLLFECNDCGKRFTNENILSIHQRVHTFDSKRPFKCKYCGSTFSSSHCLLLHLRRKHTGEKPYECDVCKKTFIDLSSCRVHMRIHSSEKPYECNLCKGKFTKKSSLNSHVRSHNNDRRYQCQVCSSKFLRPAHLTRHIRWHTGEKPYECDMCNKTFVDIDSCQVHMRTHTGEKPYECDVCGKKFAQKSALNSHSRSHSND